MKQSLTLLLVIILFSYPSALSAQKSFKAVCDKTDGLVKIIESEDRSPNMVPLKGGFPFYQVAEKWIKENYPDGKCDPAAAAKQNQEAADALNKQAAAQNQKPPDKTGQTTDLNAYFNLPAGQTIPEAPSFSYHNTSMFFSLLFSNLGKVYNLDPPLIPGMNIGVEQVLGTKFYGGTGIHLNVLIGKTEDAAGVSSLYSIRIPLFAGYRQITGTRYWGVDLGLAANTKLRPLTSESNLAGEIAADYSLNTITRVRIGKERTAFEFGVDVWVNDLLASKEGFQMMVLLLGYRFAF